VASKDRMSFEEACKDLQISEDELEQLVANGEIASIKEGDTVFFKREVVSQYKKNRKTEPTIILADEDMELLDVMDEINLDSPKGAAGKPAATPARSDVLDLDDADLSVKTPSGADAIEPRGGGPEALPAAAEGGTPDDTVLNLDGLLEDDGSEGTTPIPGAEAASKIVDESSDITVEGSVNDETLLDTDLLEIGEEEDSFKLDTASAATLSEPTEATLIRGGGARAMQMKRKKSHALLTISLVITAVLLFPPVGIALNMCQVIQVEDGGAPMAKGPSVYKWVFDSSEIAGKWWVEGIVDLFFK